MQKCNLQTIQSSTSAPSHQSTLRKLSDPGKVMWSIVTRGIKGGVMELTAVWWGIIQLTVSDGGKIGLNVGNQSSQLLKHDLSRSWSSISIEWFRLCWERILCSVCCVERGYCVGFVEKGYWLLCRLCYQLYILIFDGVCLDTKEFNLIDANHCVSSKIKNKPSWVVWAAGQRNFQKYGSWCRDWNLQLADTDTVSSEHYKLVSP